MNKILVGVVLTLAACMGDSSSESTQALSTNPAACITEASGLGRLNCTAEDVSISHATSIRIEGTSSSTSCTEGDVIPTLVGTFEVLLNTTSRLDPRFFFAIGGQGTALTGVCASNVIQPAVVNLDGDACGDIAGTQLVEITLHNVLCTAGANNQLSLPVATSWRQPGSDTVCNVFTDTGAGTKSKCNEDAGFTVPIEVKPPAGQVVKAHVGHECSTETYSVTVSNTSVRDATPSCTDSTYGDFTTVHGDPTTTLATQSGVAIIRTDCGSAVIPAGGSSACTFTGLFCGQQEADRIDCTLTDTTGQVSIHSDLVTVSVTSSATSTP